MSSGAILGVDLQVVKPTINNLRPGDIGFGPIDGPAGLLVWAGHLMLHELAILEGLQVRHVFPVVESGGSDNYPYPFAVEAMPHGARFIDIRGRFTKRYVYLRAPFAVFPERQWLGDRIAFHARAMIGTPYSFADYAALAFKHWDERHKKFKLTPEWLKDYIARETCAGYPKHAICSQLADAAISRALEDLKACDMASDDVYYHVFDDGRLPQDVTPGALFAQLLRLGWEPIWGS